MANLNKNGIKILKREEAKAESLLSEFLEEGSLNPLKTKLEEAAAIKAAKLALRKAALAKRKEVITVSIKNSKKLLAFVRGEARSLVNYEELTEDISAEADMIITPLEERVKAFLEMLLALSKSDHVDPGYVAEAILEENIQGVVNEVDTDLSSASFIINNCQLTRKELLATKRAVSDIWCSKEDIPNTVTKVANYIPEFNREGGRYLAGKRSGISRPDLSQFANIDSKAFAYIDKKATELGLNPKEVYDSCGFYGFDPREVERAWFAAGCKLRGTFRYWVVTNLNILKEKGNIGRNYLRPADKNQAVKEYKGERNFDIFFNKYSKYMKNYVNLSAYYIAPGDVKRLARIKSTVSKYLALEHASYVEVYTKTELRGRYNNVPFERKVRKARIDWEKLANLLKLDRKEKAGLLPFSLAWTVLFNRKAPVGLGYRDPNPTVLLDKVTQRTFRQLMSIVKEDLKYDTLDSLKATTKAAYHLAVAFRDIQTVKRWVSKVAGDLTALNIHDAIVTADDLLKLKYKAGWVKLLVQFPELRWSTHHMKGFENEFGRLPSGKKEFEEFAAAQLYVNVKLKDVAAIAAECDRSQSQFEDYQMFFKNNPPKKSEMLPYVEVVDGNYKFYKMDHDDIRGPFLGCYTDCCQHFHNAGRSCAKAGWRNPSSGFYVIEKDGEIIVQSWAWRGKNGELCFDSIEAKGKINISRVAKMYVEAGNKLLGKLGITKITVGLTNYGITSKVRKDLGVPNEPMKGKAKMIDETSYTDARKQWVLPEVYEGDL